MSNRLIDYAPEDNWSDLLSTKNPITEAHDCGDNISFEVYSRQAEGVKRGHPDYVLSGSDLNEFDRCPHRWLVGFRDDATNATEWGQVIDCLLMTPEDFANRFAVAPETYAATVMECPTCKSRTDAKTCRKCKCDRVPVQIQKEWDFGATVCQEWREQQGGKQIVKTATLRKAENAIRELQGDSQIHGLILSSRKQVMITGFYDDEETGLRIPLRCLIDLAPPSKFLADLKTCNCAHPKQWARHVHQFGYHTQAARHLDLWNAAHGEKRNEFRHYIQESFEPFEVGKRILSSEFLRLGRMTYVRALKRYARCVKEQRFPGYDETNNPSDLVIDEHLVTSPEAWMVEA
jgi:hypothetical protein